MIDISDKLKVRKASMYATIHENELTGLKRTLFWDITVNFEPETIMIHDQEKELETSLSCGWIRIPVMDYRQIKNFQFNQDNPSGIETTFYLHEHDCVDQLSGSLSYDGSAMFTLHIHVKHHIRYAFEEELIIDKHFSTQVEYTGLMIVPGNININEDDVEAVKKAASEYVHLEDYDEPVSVKGFRYDFKPK